MRIRDVMTKDPVTVESQALILDARRLMKEKNFRRLPVVDKGKLVGIITLKDIEEAIPPATTSSSAHEYLNVFSKTKVKEVMRKDLVTISPETPFEEVLRIGQKKKISSFLVVDGDKLVGIATESDTVRFLNRVLGLEEEGSRITIEGLGGKLGRDLKEIIAVLEKNKTVLLSMLSMPRPEKKDWMIALRIKAKEPDSLVNNLKEAGFNVTYLG